MNLTLNLSSNKLDDESLQALTRELCRSIADETDIQAEIPSGTVTQGTKGEPITIGVIALAVLSSPAIVALCNVLEAYFNRPLEAIELEKADGTKFKLTSKTIKLEDVQKFLSE